MGFSKKYRWVGYPLSILLVAIVTFAGSNMRGLFSETDVIMLFLVGAVAAAAALGGGPALLYSALSVSAFNYFFVEPRFTFDTHMPSYSLTFGVMFFACIVISTLAARLREQVLLARRREQEVRMLYALVQDLAASSAREEMGEAFLRHLTEDLPVSARLKFADDTELGKLESGARHSFTIPDMRGSLDVASKEPLATDQIRIIETAARLLSSALRRAETATAAEQAKILAEREKSRSTLLLSMSHDLRSPLAAISGAAETLLSRKQDDSLLQSIRKEAGRVTRIVSNLLDITRIEGGNIRLNMHPYDPAEIIGTAAEACRELLQGYELVIELEKNLPLVRMDGLLVSQLIQNLLENAAAHTPAGTKITLNAYVREGSFCLAVADNGPGIPEGQEKAIFDKFATQGQGDRPKGTGLGLAICLAIAAAHQGHIHAANRAEGGARFVLELPPSLTLPDKREALHAK